MYAAVAYGVKGAAQSTHDYHWFCIDFVHYAHIYGVVRIGNLESRRPLVTISPLPFRF